MEIHTPKMVIVNWLMEGEGLEFELKTRSLSDEYDWIREANVVGVSVTRAICADWLQKHPDLTKITLELGADNYTGGEVVGDNSLLVCELRKNESVYGVNLYQANPRTTKVVIPHLENPLLESIKIIVKFDSLKVTKLPAPLELEFILYSLT